MKRQILTLAIVIASTLGAPILCQATEQIPDIVIYNGEEIYKNVFFSPTPLKVYFLETYRTQLNIGSSISTNLWRGHIATYLIDNDRLYIKKIESNKI